MSDASSKTSPAPTGAAASLPVWPPLAILIVVFIYFGSMIIGELLLGAYPWLRHYSATQSTQWLNKTYIQFLYVVVVESVTLGALVWCIRKLKLNLRMLGLIKPRLRDFGITLLAYPPYFVVNAAATIAATLVFHLNTKQQQQTGFQTAAGGFDLVLAFISLVILPPLVEEIAMRGFLFGSLKHSMSVVKAALLTSLIFSIAHLQLGAGAPPLWTAAIDTFVLSLTLCYLRQKTGSLWAGIGLHALKNCLAFSALYVFPRLH